MRRVTLKQIAAAVGLSTFAVSRALAGKDGVSEATRLAVAAAAEGLGYVRPAPARREIGFVLHDLDAINSELHMEHQFGVEAEAHRLGCSVRLAWAHEPARIVELAQGRAGLLLVGPHAPATAAALREAGVPAVQLGWVDPMQPVDQVSGGDREAGQAVARYLIGLGHRRIAYVHGVPGLRGRRERLAGLRDIVSATPGATLKSLEFEDTRDFTAVLDDLARRGPLPTAFFCAHDSLALTAVSELLARGLRIPEDASVVGFGDFHQARQISPPLTTVRLDGREMGAVALRLLLERIERPPEPGAPVLRIHVVSPLVERRSSGPAPRGPVAARRRPD